MKYLCGLFLLVLSLLAGCNTTEDVLNPDATVTVTGMPEQIQPTSTPTPLPTSTPIPTPTSTPTPTPTPLPDVEAPVLTLNGENYVEVIARNVYEDMGYVAIDNYDGDLTDKVIVTGEVDVNLCGEYILTYEVSDIAGNVAKAERTVLVKQPETVTPEGKVIYLTFDDGPGKYTNDVLDLLDKYGIKATFFTCVNGQPNMVTKIYERGHSIAIHCKSHDYKVVYASEEAYFEDLFAIQDIIYECTGIRTTMVRFPGGSSNTASKFNPGIMTRLTEQLNLQGFQYYDWNVSSGDVNTKDSQVVLDNLINDVKNRKCSVVLTHAETKSHTVDALEEFILWAFENGYTFLPLDPTSPKAHHRIFN